MSEELVQTAPVTLMGRLQGFQSKARVNGGHESSCLLQPFWNTGASIFVPALLSLCLGVDRRIDREEASPSKHRSFSTLLAKPSQKRNTPLGTAPSLHSTQKGLGPGQQACCLSIHPRHTESSPSPHLWATLCPEEFNASLQTCIELLLSTWAPS